RHPHLVSASVATQAPPPDGAAQGKKAAIRSRLPTRATNEYRRLMSLQKLNREDRQRLMRFVCSFAWADLEVKKTERALVQKMMKKLAMDEGGRAMVKEWLQVPPRAEDVDPQSIPPAQRKMFLEAAREMI